MFNYGFVVFSWPRHPQPVQPGCFHPPWAFPTPHVARPLWHNAGDALPLRVAQSVSFEDSSTPWWEVNGCESVGLQFQSKSLGMTLWYFKVVRGVLNYTWIPVASQIWVLWMLVARNQLKSFRSLSLSLTNQEPYLNGSDCAKNSWRKGKLTIFHINRYNSTIFKM